MKKLAIYSAIIGNYDQLPAHPAICPRADYYLFVGKGEAAKAVPGPWTVRELDYSNRDPKLVSGYAKTHPRTLLPEYEYTLWVDANVGIAQEAFFSVLQRKMEEGVPLSGVLHGGTDCAYEEAVRIVKGGRDSIFNVLRMIGFLRRNGLPGHAGLLETGVLLRRSGTDAAVTDFDENWWTLISGISRRDQLSVSYCMRKAGLVPDALVPAGADVRNHPFFSYTPHRTPSPQRSFLYRKTRGPLVALTKWYAER